MKTAMEQPTVASLLDGIVVSPSVFVETNELTLQDRCDSCNAAAYVRAVKDNSELLFCGNHARRNLIALTEQGWKIDDQTFRVFDTNNGTSSMK